MTMLTFILILCFKNYIILHSQYVTGAFITRLKFSLLCAIALSVKSIHFPFSSLPNTVDFLKQEKNGKQETFQVARADDSG